MSEPIILVFDQGVLTKIATRSGNCPPIVSLDWADIDEDDEGAISLTDPWANASEPESCWVGLISEQCEKAPDDLADFARIVSMTGIDSNAKLAAFAARMAAQTEGGPSFT